MSHLDLGPGPEFDRIRSIEKALGPRAGELGDDCALVLVGDEFIALSIDLSVEGVHFRREWLSLEEIGWKAAAGALSDLAAEAARPEGLLASVGVPKAGDPGEVANSMRGVGEAAASVGGRVLGGDLSSAPVLTIDIAVVGRTARPVRRQGAQVGDGIWVTGELGGARAALASWSAGETPITTARRSFAHPVPRIGAGLWLAERGAHALIDLSDGLAGDAGHLAAASRVMIELALDRVPLHGAVPAAALKTSQLPAVFAALGGEGYELLVAMPRQFTSADAGALEREMGIPLTLIGRVSAGSGAVCRLQGREVALTGFDHFA